MIDATVFANGDHDAPQPAEEWLRMLTSERQLSRAVSDLPVGSEADLVDLAHDIDIIRTEVFHGTH